MSSLARGRYPGTVVTGRILGVPGNGFGVTLPLRPAEALQKHGFGATSLRAGLITAGLGGVPTLSVPSVELTSPRLLLRRFTPADGLALHTYLSRPEAVEFEPYGVIDAGEADRWAEQRATDPAFWAICLREGGDLVGNLYLASVAPPEWRTWELGYVLHPDHWGRGYATEATIRLLDACFGTWGAHRVTASCDVANTASWRLLERLGFRREGHLLAASSFHQDAEGRPIWKDDYVYAVLDHEWRDGRGRTPDARDGDRWRPDPGAGLPARSGRPRPS